MATDTPLDFIVKSSVNIKSLGDPRKLAANLESDGMRALLGTIIGIAQGVVRRADVAGGPDRVGLAGAFTAVPVEVNRPEVRSSICFLPEAILGPIIATIKTVRDKDPTATVRFAIEAGVQKGGTAGFTWEFRPMFDGSAGAMVDPLAELRTAVKSGVKALPKQTAAEKAAIDSVPEVGPSRFDKKEEKPHAKGAART
jgi:hypothetical protein